MGSDARRCDPQAASRSWHVLAAPDAMDTKSRAGISKLRAPGQCKCKLLATNEYRPDADYSVERPPANFAAMGPLACRNGSQGCVRLSLWNRRCHQFTNAPQRLHVALERQSINGDRRLTRDAIHQWALLDHRPQQFPLAVHVEEVGTQLLATKTSHSRGQAVSAPIADSADDQVIRWHPASDQP